MYGSRQVSCCAFEDGQENFPRTQKAGFSGLAESCRCGNEENRREIDFSSAAFGLRLPVFVIAQEIVLVPVVHRSLQEQPADAQMSHFLESAVGGVDAATDDSEAFPLHLLSEKVILGEGHLLMESAELAELLKLEQHEHSGRKGMVQARQELK